VAEEEPMLEWVEQASTTVGTPMLSGWLTDTGGGRMISPRMRGSDVICVGEVGVENVVLEGAKEEYGVYWHGS